MVNEFCGFKHGVIGTDKMPADTTLNNMKKADLIKLLHTAQHNYESLMWFYNNAVKANMSQLNNNGWIPCSERLPEETECYFVTWRDRATCKTYVEITEYDAGSQEWLDCICQAGLLGYDIIAWQPLPAPYQPKGE